MSTLQQATTRALRLLAPNPGPMTLDGTNTWVLREPGADGCVVVDPGPLDAAHLARVVEHGPVALIVLTHGHADHAEGAPRLHELTGAPVLARDPALCIDIEPLRDEQVVDIAGVDWLTVLTPGHSSDSISLLLRADRALLTGDTVLGRGTTVVAHPDGRLGDYLDSLQRLRDLADNEIDVLLPGHGPVLDAPVEVLDHYLAHRADRLSQVRAAVAAGAVDAADVVRQVYADVDPALWPAAELSVQAQLEFLRTRGPGGAAPRPRGTPEPR
ncbi:MAG TPA: MBL fold metallo-hydrolase [Mycobacteriales bacterium]|nr:MBL fold metallo-hydrolase [Mycobacteriales bacterium]